MRANWVGHGMSKSWRLCGLRCPHVLGVTVWASAVRRSECRGSTDALPASVLWMIKQCTNVVDEQGVQLLSNLLFVCEIKSTIEWDPFGNRQLVTRK